MATKKQIATAKKNIKKARKALKPATDKFMRKKGKTKGKAISTKARKKYATIVEKKKGKRKKVIKRYRFPIPDKAHARNALARLNQAEGLSHEERLKIVRRALRKLGRKESAEEWLKKHSL